MTASLRFGRIAGISVGARWSALLIALLIAWSLAGRLLPAQAPGLAPGAYWLADRPGPAWPWGRCWPTRSATPWSPAGPGSGSGASPCGCSAGSPCSRTSPPAPATSCGWRWSARPSAWPWPSPSGWPRSPCRSPAAPRWRWPWSPGYRRQPRPGPVQPARAAAGRRPGAGAGRAALRQPRPRSVVAATAGQWVGAGLIGYGLLGALTGWGFGSLWTALVGWFLVAAARQERDHAVPARPGRGSGPTR